MDRQALTALLLKLLEEETGDKFPNLCDDLDLRTGLNLDSLDMASLIMHIECELKIHVETDELQEVPTVGGLLDLLQAKVDAPPTEKRLKTLSLLAWIGLLMATVSRQFTASADLICAGAVTAFGVIEASKADIAALRDDPGCGSTRQIPAPFLRHSDEQSVVGLAAVMQAIEKYLPEENFDHWGVLAAPKCQGRLIAGSSMVRFHTEGPATTSPHIIPQISMHAMAGAISVALGMHGTNFGIGGACDAVEEGLLTALSYLDDAAMPGVWLVLSQWSPEPIPDGKGSTESDAICRAVALALGPSDNPLFTLQLSKCDTDAREPARLEDLANWLLGRAIGSQWSSSLAWGGKIELA